jgi:AraC family transcriptional regulator
LSDFTIVAYKRGSTSMERRFEGTWTRTECHPGDMSLLTRAQLSHWRWTEEIDVEHVYISGTFLSKVAEDAWDREIADVRLHDLLRVRDPVVTACVEAIGAEATQTAIGGSLYVSALTTQLAMHLLRKYAVVSCVDKSGHGVIAAPLRERLVEYIEARLNEAVTLDELAGVAGMGVWTFGKRFLATFGQTPHDYVLRRRLDRACGLLVHGIEPIKSVAAACGFADQAHLTRAMRARIGTTPGALRRLRD